MEILMWHRKIWVLAIFLSLISCSMFKPSSVVDADILCTDSTMVIYDDSIDAILLNAHKVRLYEMADFVMQGDSVKNIDSIFKYRIKCVIGLLDKKCANILSFVISDKYWYIKDYAPVRQPFHPNLTLEFIHHHKKAYMFVSFGTEEVAISDMEGNFKFYQMNDKRILARWACMVFPEEKYYEELIKQ